MEIRPNPKLRPFIIFIPFIILAAVTIMTLVSEGVGVAIVAAVIVSVPIGIFIPLALYDLRHALYIVHGDKIIVKRKSLFKRTEREMPFTKVENVELRTNIFSDYINSGAIIVSGTGGVTVKTTAEGVTLKGVSVTGHGR
jgi:uncharacterized membrane protein YdbT with pleckstrin-like domain